MEYRSFFTGIIVLLITASVAMAQDGDKKQPEITGNDVFVRDSIPELSLNPDSTLKAAKKKKKKQKKNLFYGIKCRRGFTREGVGEREVVELFYVMKKYKEPTSYVDELYVWDVIKNKVVKVRKDDLAKLTNYKILHGPYTKYVGGKMSETGIFYVGTKHGRWEKYKWEKKWWEKEDPKALRYNGSSEATMIPILMAKTKYYKGFQREAKITYYDFEHTKVKEVVPYEYGEKTGDYYFFLENGQLLVKGHFAEGKKTGLWVEYFPDKNRRKRETQCPKDQWDTTPAVILKEWDEKGNLIIVNGQPVPQDQKNTNDPIRKSLKKKK